MGARKTIFVAALVWHALAVLAAFGHALDDRGGRDFASYYYAAKVVQQGGNPYDRTAVSQAARSDGTRRSVHPFFYPPPFLAVMGSVTALDLKTAYRLWFWLDEIALVVAGLALWRWWRPLGTATLVAMMAVMALSTSIPDNHLMGQANLPVLALVVLAMTQQERRPVIAGLFLGTAMLLKMSPGLFAAYWLTQRRWVAFLTTLAWAVALSVAIVPLVPFETQWDFYARVLPQFGSGDYNGLDIPISLFGNHSVPNLFYRLFPGPADRLSGTAGLLSLLVLMPVIAMLLWAFRDRSGDPWREAARFCALAAAMLLVPVYTYEHHMVWAIPAAGLAVSALVAGRLSTTWAAPVGAAIAVFAFDISELKSLWSAVRLHSAVLDALIPELKFVALVICLSAAVAIARPSRVEVSP